MLLVLLRCLGPLLHLQSQQACLGTAHGSSLVSLLLIESIAALVEGVNLCLAFLLLVPILSQAVCIWLVLVSGMQSHGSVP